MKLRWGCLFDDRIVIISELKYEMSINQMVGAWEKLTRKTYFFLVNVSQAPTFIWKSISTYYLCPFWEDYSSKRQLRSKLVGFNARDMHTRRYWNVRRNLVSLAFGNKDNCKYNDESSFSLCNVIKVGGIYFGIPWDA